MHCALCIVHGALCIAHCALCSLQCAVYSVQCTVYSVQFTVNSVQCTVYNVQCTVEVSSFQYTLFMYNALSPLLTSAQISKSHKGAGHESEGDSKSMLKYRPRLLLCSYLSSPGLCLLSFLLCSISFIISLFPQIFLFTSPISS